MDKRVNKKTGEELQQFLAFRKRASRVPSKKGKGSYNRNNFKKGVQEYESLHSCATVQAVLSNYRCFC